MNRSKYDVIGDKYNSTRKPDPYIVSRILNLLNPSKDKSYIDIGCGTGNYTMALAARGLKFTGVEPSGKMLEEARLRSTAIEWISGTAEKIPVDDKMYDGAIATLTIHHWSDLEKAFKEVNRVLTENAHLVIFTSDPGQMKGYWLNHYFPKMLQSSIVQMPSLETIEKTASSAGFEIVGLEKYFVRNDLHDYFLYAGKNNPELYFDENIRNGISSFRTLTNSDEVKEGLLKLRDDIDAGYFESIKNKFNNSSGDYLFLVLVKK